jgi:hypothetical protein
MEYVVEYLSYEGNIRTITVDADSEEDAINVAFNSELNYSGDNIQKIISVIE